MRGAIQARRPLSTPRRQRTKTQRPIGPDACSCCCRVSFIMIIFHDQYLSTEMVTSLLQLYIQASDCYHAENSPGLNLVQTLGRKKRLIHSMEDRVFPPFPCSPARHRPSDQQPPLPFPLTPAPPAPAPIADRSLLQVVRRFVRSFLLQRFGPFPPSIDDCNFALQTAG